LSDISISTLASVALAQDEDMYGECFESTCIDDDDENEDDGDGFFDWLDEQDILWESFTENCQWEETFTVGVGIASYSRTEIYNGTRDACTDGDSFCFSGFCG